MYSACMVALQIRDVPPAVREALAREARRRGQSLQAYLLDIVEAEAARRDNVDLITAVVELGGGLTGVEREPSSSDVLRSLRDEREAGLARDR